MFQWTPSSETSYVIHNTAPLSRDSTEIAADLPIHPEPVVMQEVLTCIPDATVETQKDRALTGNLANKHSTAVRCIKAECRDL